ncbi:MAG: hypothetical protein IIA45_15155 [Bacteroidetes bacterium]|nr:hypothetical protein [Bacteroidota bacterium]
MSRINYETLAIEGLKEVLEQVGTVCKELKIEFFLVGAVARNIWYASNGKDIVGTKDIDFGIYVSSEKEYNQLRKKLLEEYNYHESTENDFCLITSQGKEVDLLPFGEIENEGQVLIEGKGLVQVGLDGFKESYEMGLTKVQIGEDTYMSCSIPAIVILKLIAYDDRPDRRIKDVSDINSICKYYPEIESESIWSHHSDLYEDETDHQDVAMVVLGREIKKIIEGNSKLKSRVLNILDKAINQDSNLLIHMIENPDTETLDLKEKVLRNIKQGIIE